MPFLSIRHGLTYFYTDNGVPNTPNYKTMIMIHGYGGHSGLFQKLNPLTLAKGLRLICLNRREYPGSTSFTEEELKRLNDGSEPERADMIAQQGADYALFVDGVIKECALPKDGGVILTGYSLGNIFLLSILASITSLPVDTQNRLKEYVTVAIMLDPPSQAIGGKSPAQSYVPTWDEEIPPESRGMAFGIWATSYFKHGDLSTRDINQLVYREANISKTPSILTMSPEEFEATNDFSAGEKWEDRINLPHNINILSSQTKKALFNPFIKAAWNNLPMWHVYGTSGPWNVVYAAWVLEDWLQEVDFKQPEPLIKFKPVDGANHGFTWDEPQRALDCLLEYEVRFNIRLV
ncbi:Alpha/Beta hydrolase protein [Cyathus striatus]|nr:Alpha/Beta hydrolase protein [Cyathus striatus]